MDGNPTDAVDNPAPRKLPDWAREPLVHFLNSLKRSHDFYHLAIDGITIIYKSFERVEELTAELQKLDDEAGIKRDPEPDELKRREWAKGRAELAQNEVNQGFPLLHEQAAVDIWATIEVLAKELAAAWLENYTGATQIDAVRRIRIRLADYEAMSPGERYDYLVSELERELSAALKSGVNRFETLLEPFGLSGPVDDTTKKELFELSHVRNVIVHRRGAADKKLIEACPWLGLRPGDPVKIDSDAYHRYFDAAFEYEKIVLDRLNRFFDVTRVGGTESSSAGQ